jgi:hypothetical protein
MTTGGKTSVLRLLGGGGDLVLPDQKGVTKVVISIIFLQLSIRDTQIFSKFSRRYCMDIPDDIETGDVRHLHTHIHGSFAPAWLGRSSK